MPRTRIPYTPQFSFYEDEPNGIFMTQPDGSPMNVAQLTKDGEFIDPATGWPLNIESPHNILTKSLCGGVIVTNATTFNFTSNHQMVLAAPFFAVQIGVRSAHTAAIPGIKVQVAPSSTFGAAGTAASRTPTSAFTNCTFGGAATGTLAAGAAANDTITWFDWTELSNVARSDSGVLPVLHVRVESPTDATNNFYTNFNIADWISGFNVEANIAGGRGYLAVNQATDGITTPANFTQTTSSQTPIAIVVRYATLVPGRTIMTVGDSLSQGGGSTYKCYSDAERAAFARSTVNSPIEVCNLGWGGQTTTAYYARALAALTALAEIKPSDLIYAPFSPNDGTVITTTTVNAMKSRLARVAIACKKYNVNLVLANGMPSTPGGSGLDFNATDALRVAFNAEMLKYGYPVYDRASVYSGATDADGQVNILAGLTTDNLHPNETGWPVLATKLISTLGL